MKTTITLGEQELQLISKALDFYCRMGLGQFNYLTENYTIQAELWKDETGNTEHKFQEVVKELKKVYGLDSNASHGIFNKEHVGDDCRIAAHLHQQIRHELYKVDEKMSKPQYTVNAYPADICQIAKMKEPDFNLKIEKNVNIIP